MTLRVAWTTLILLLAGTAPAVAQATAGAPEPFKVAFSSTLFGGVNLNDAKAAIGVWAKSIAESRNVRVAPATDVFEDLTTLARAMDTGGAHLVIVSVNQYRQLGRPRFGTLLFGTRGGQTRDAFVLLAKKGRFSSPCDLRGRAIVALEGTGYDLSLTWLDSALREAGCGPLEGFFSSLTTAAKAARAALPVFFGQQDACLTSAYNHGLMVELNPQMGVELVPVASSPPLVHAVVLLARGFSAQHRPAVLEALLALNQTPRGRQVLSLFGLDGMSLGNDADLAPSLALLDTLDRGTAGRVRK